MIYTFIARQCADLPVATACRVMKVSTSGFYAWRKCPVTDRDWDDAAFTNTIVDIHRMSRRSYGSPRVHAEGRPVRHRMQGRDQRKPSSSVGSDDRGMNPMA